MAMHILVLGATGLLGRAVCERLLASGCRVSGFGNAPPASGELEGIHWCSGDFSRRTRPRHWRSELPGVDVVINTIGVFEERYLQGFHVMHDEAPNALWQACADYGVRRVIHLSALGAAHDAPTEYWRSKARGDAGLLAQAELEGWVVRPSLIYADHGRSATLCRQQAVAPLLAVPADAGEIQPVHLDDVAELIVRLALDPPPEGSRIIAAVGPQSMRWAAYLQTLRQGMGLQPARILPVPRWIAAGIAWFAEHRPGSLLTRQSLRMLRAGCQGEAGDAARLAALIGRPLRQPAQFAGPELRVASLWSVWRPVLLGALAFLWLFTAVVSLGQTPLGLQLLADTGVPEALRWPALWAGIALDALFGVLTLWRPSRRLWQAQLLVVLAYTLLLTLGASHWWLHPFGPLSKNLPILALLGWLAAMEKR